MIAQHYLHGWFPLDLLSVFPFELIITGSKRSEGTADTKNLRLIAFVKAPRLLRLSKVLRYLDRLGNATVIKILRLFMLFCFITHLAACGLNFLEASQDEGPGGRTWFKSQIVRAEKTTTPHTRLPDGSCRASDDSRLCC